MTQPASSVLIAGMLVLGTIAVAQAQGVHQYVFPGNSPGYVGGPKTGSYAGVPTGTGPLSYPMPPATSAWAYRPYYRGQVRTLRRY